MIRIKSTIFGLEHLRASEVWTWEKTLTENEDTLIPVALTEESLKDAETLLIHSRFQTASGNRLEGVVLYNIEQNEVFAIQVLIGNEKYTFNKYAPDLSSDELERLATFTNEHRVEELLPIRYEIVPQELAIDGGQFTF